MTADEAKARVKKAMARWADRQSDRETQDARVPAAIPPRVSPSPSGGYPRASRGARATSLQPDKSNQPAEQAEGGQDV